MLVVNGRACSVSLSRGLQAVLLSAGAGYAHFWSKPLLNVLLPRGCADYPGRYAGKTGPNREEFY